jgi:Macrocin-O-methyltransferase (TylF)
MEAKELYLDLLKGSLTNTLYGAEPNADGDQSLYVREFVHHYIDAPAVSMLPLARMANLQECVVDVIRRQIPGDLIETGVWRGGATIFMRAILKAYGVTDRMVWAADSFEGLPEPDPEKFPVESKFHRDPLMKEYYRNFAAGLPEVKRNFAAYGLLDNQVEFLQGWFKDTLPHAPIAKLAVMRLDGDYYESTMDALTGLYDKLSVGGYVIIDDYGQEAWTYCRQAVDEFRSRRGITDEKLKVDSSCCFWQRTQ